MNNGIDNFIEPAAVQAGSNRRDWKYFNEKLGELRRHDIENIIACGQVLIEAHEELERGSYEITVKRHFDLSYARTDIEVRRIALNLDQVRQHAPPPNFVKETDTRTSGYRERFGTDECWELDALSPTVIVDLIRSEIEEGLIDRKRWHRTITSENRGRQLLAGAAENWTKVKKLLWRSSSTFPQEQFEVLKAAEESEREIIGRLVGKISKRGRRPHG
jgi:hypothetical protein